MVALLFGGRAVIWLLIVSAAFVVGWQLGRRRDLVAAHPLPAAAPVASALEPSGRLLEQALESVRKAHGAERAVLWTITPRGDRALPWFVRGGTFPNPVSLTGDLLGWVARQGVTLRHDAPPEWGAVGVRACAVTPVRWQSTFALLSVEYVDVRDLPAINDLERAGLYLAGLIHVEYERNLTRAEREHLNGLLDILRTLPTEIEPEAVGQKLAAAAIEITHASGAAVSEWSAERGRVIAVAGDDGITLGTTFSAAESETALAARAHDTITRNGRTRAALPIISTTESFTRRPRALTAIPLKAANDVVGVLTVWTQEDELDEVRLETLHTLTPYAALQFRHAQAYEQLRERADRDRLTGLLNRHAFDARLAAEDARFDRYPHPFALLLIDVDHFKSVNDRYGHPTGDAVLAHLGRLLTNTLREVDVAARFGGEEFAVLLPETPLDLAWDIAERLRARIADTVIHAPGGQQSVTVSIGVSAYPECAHSPDALIRTADAALYVSKHEGRNRVTAARAVKLT